jgi:tetratricopeptide (TPR) repeat protein
VRTLLHHACSDDDTDDHKAVVESLKHFSLKGSRIAQLNAVDLLERILEPQDTDHWTIGPDARFEAASALEDYGRHYGRMGALRSSVSGYEKIVEEDWTREDNPRRWASTNYQLGEALGSLGSSTDDVDALKQAVMAFRHEQEIVTREENAEGWAQTQSSIAEILMSIGKLQKTIAPLEEALAAIRDCLEITPDDDDYKATLKQIEAAIEELKR